MQPSSRSKWAVIGSPTAESELPKYRCVVLAFALAIVIPATGVAAEKPQYFSIMMKDKLIGYAMVESDTITRAGRTLMRLKSETSLKVALLGKERNTRLESETIVDPETNSPVSYHMTDTTNEVVQVVEAEFSKGTARSWIYRQSDQRPQPQEIQLADDTVILGGNNFAHWQLLLKTAADRTVDGVAKVSVFRPDSGKVESFELVRGDAKEVVLTSGIRECVTWRLESANLYALTDTQTNELVRMELPGQQTTIELASERVVKLAQKSRAEELLTLHFTQSNVLFDDFLAIHAMQAEVDVKVIGSGTANSASVLTTTMQQFDGVKEADHIKGTVSIRSVNYDSKESPAFAAQPNESELGEWLEPSAYIESDHPSIVAKSSELTAGAKTRWDAVQRIGKWVSGGNLLHHCGHAVSAVGS